MTYSVIDANGEVAPGNSTGLCLTEAAAKAKTHLGSYSPFCRVRNDIDGSVAKIAGMTKRGTPALEWLD